MMTTSVNMLVLSYYDGATEGFFDVIDDGLVYYFKVVAWDENQDQRLYVLATVSRDDYLELFDIFVMSKDSPTAPTWAPTWKFASPELEARATEIVEIGRRAANNPTFLALGNNLSGAERVVQLMPKGLASAIALLKGRMPRRLADWFASNA
jgi:hypothetical protein